jgi:Arc/MetJ-type ribon-helix-helix transcriptional regulator
MSKQITVRLTDDELAKQVDELADEFGSTSEVVREAIRNLSDTDDETLPDKIERADEHIRKLWSPGDTVQIETVETTIAQELQLNKGAIRRSVIRPLVDRGRLHKQQTMRNVFVTIAPEEVSDE